MKKEIKFKVWDNWNKKFLDYGEVDIWDLVFAEPKLMEEIYTDGMANECLIFLQYTGIKDKNGKEIYEGDLLVVRTLHDGDEYCWDNDNQKPIPQKVKWDDDYLCFDFGGCSRVKYSPHDFEVIGNIYENPELLTNIN